MGHSVVFVSAWVPWRDSWTNWESPGNRNRARTKDQQGGPTMMQVQQQGVDRPGLCSDDVDTLPKVSKDRREHQAVRTLPT